MTSRSQQLRRFVRRALVDASGAAVPDPEQLAAAFDSLCERLRTHLQPMFGATAVNALFARSLHLSAAEFPWLRRVFPGDVSACVMEAIEASGSLPLDNVQEGLAALLAHEIELLSTFIGDDLVLPLVQQAWGAATLAEAPARTEDDP